MRATEVASEPQAGQLDRLASVTPLSVRESTLPNSPQIDRLLISLNLKEAIRDRSSFLTNAVNEAKEDREAGSPLIQDKIGWDSEHYPAYSTDADKPADGIYGADQGEADWINSPEYRRESMAPKWLQRLLDHPRAQAIKEHTKQVLNHPTTRVGLRIAAAVGLAFFPIAIDMAHPHAVQADSDPAFANPPSGDNPLLDSVPPETIGADDGVTPVDVAGATVPPVDDEVILDENGERVVMAPLDAPQEAPIENEEDDDEIKDGELVAQLLPSEQQVAQLIIPASPLVVPAAAPATAEAAPDRIVLNPNFVIAEGVSSEDTNAVREGIRIANNYYSHHFNADWPNPFRVDIVNSDASASAGGRFGIALYTQFPSWKSATPIEKVKIAVHETFHPIQISLAGTSGARGPWWISEGSAEYIANMALVEEGLISYDAMKNCFLTSFPRNANSPILTENTQNYQLAALAVDFLVQRSGLNSLLDYNDWFRTVGGSAAFQAAFGMSQETFYAQFDQAMRNTPFPQNAATACPILYR